MKTSNIEHFSNLGQRGLIEFINWDYHNEMITSGFLTYESMVSALAASEGIVLISKHR